MSRHFLHPEQSPTERDFAVLVGMSATEVAARSELASLAANLGASLAFLQVASPSLHSELFRLKDLGADRITVVGIGRSRLGPGVSWLGRVADSWWRDHGAGIEVAASNRLLRSGAEAEAVWSETIARARVVRGTSAPLKSPAWEQVPNHERQVLICRGPRCSAAGAEQTHEALVLAMMQTGLGDAHALLTTTGCQYPCNQAPVISVQPDDIWYGRVGPEQAVAIVTSHLREGHPVDDTRLPRQPLGPPSP